MSRSIALRVSPRLVDLIDRMARRYARNTGADPASFYVEYYLHFLPHAAALNRIGECLGIGPAHRVLEVGSGLGTRCLLGRALWGADFTGLEPCFNTYGPLRDAIQEFRDLHPELPYMPVDRPGEDTGLPSGGFDTVLCFEVVEHVQDPSRVIEEIHRVLKPGGTLFLSTCNYRSFYEGHYRCLWLPFLRRRSGRLWARILGRNPAFLDEVNFITRAALLRHLKAAGFTDIERDPVLPRVPAPTLRVDYPPGFTPVMPDKRRSFMQGFIQRPRVHRALSRFGMEYKVYVRARKPC
jgi:SAM-dependent methyltransferase